jgi:hypothetical protein
MCITENTNYAIVKLAIVEITGKNESPNGDVFVNFHGRVKWKIFINDGITQIRDGVSAHRYKQRRVSEHHG